MTRQPTPAEQAVIDAGWNFHAFAHRLNRSHRYVRDLLRHGRFPLNLADKAARLCHCSGNVFLHPTAYTIALNDAGSFGDAQDAVAGSTGIAARPRRRVSPHRVTILELK